MAYLGYLDVCNDIWLFGHARGHPIAMGSTWMTSGHLMDTQWICDGRLFGYLGIWDKKTSDLC